MINKLLNSGVYSIINNINRKRYIGSAYKLNDRKSSHWSELKRHIHGNKHLQNAWYKYGESAFEFKTMLICSKNDCLFYEQKCIDRFKPEYNILPTAGSLAGFIHSEESKYRMSIAKIGVKHSAERCANNSKSKMGRVVSAETRVKNSEAGRNISNETRIKRSKSLMGNENASIRGSRAFAVSAGIEELYKSGLSLIEIGKRLDMNHNTIRATLLLLGVKMRSKNGRNKERDELGRYK